VSAGAYVPMMLRPGWVLERYYGWHAVREEDGRLKLLRKRRGAVRTFLLLCRGVAEVEIADVVARHGLAGPLSIAVLSDFSRRDGGETLDIAGRRFRRTEGARWFGVGTFVFDLAEDRDSLWSRISARERTKCRQAESLGVQVRLSTAPSSDEIDRFLGLYGAMAREKGLEPVSRPVLERMFAERDLVLAHCIGADGASLVMNLVYMRGDQAYFLHGARAETVPAGAAHYAQWKAIEWLKQAGCRWYDFGLVASRDPGDGIYRFKKSLGGTFVDFGQEFHRVPSGLRAAYDAFRGLRTRLRRRP